MCVHKEMTLLTKQATAQTILLVEDEALIALSEKALLQKHGFIVLTAANGTMAVDLALRTPQLDLILMDIDLGTGMDGTKAAQQILAQRDVPIVFLSGYTEPEVVEKTEKITSYGYVVKNSGETVLITSIKMAFKLFDAYQRLKHQEAALRKTKQELQLLFDTVPALIWQKDRTGRYMQVNKAYCDTVGLSEDAILGKTDKELYPPEIADQYMSTDRKVLNSGVSEFGIEQRYQKSSGECGWNRTDKLPYYDSPGNIAGTIGFALDITDHKLTEEALRESEKRFNLFMQHLPGLAFIKDSEGRLLFVNAYHARLYPLDSNKLIGQNLKNFWGPEFIAQFNEQDRVVLASRQPLTIEESYPDREGLKCWLTCKFPIFQRDQLTLIGGISVDITARKRAEEALRESERQLRKHNVQKDKFFSILAHDLKNPLIGFVSFANLLEHDFDRMDSEERQMLIQNFHTSTEMLSALLDNLLTWARMQQGQVECSFDQFSLDQLTARAVALLTPIAMHKQITLINATPPVDVYADIEMVDTVVRNLLINAIKFTPADGEVTITAAQTAHDVCVTVADTGIGISPNKIAQLFRIDERIQRDGTNGEKGTGLGLILCKEFVEKQGGVIWAESEPGKGTRVMFTLPTQSPEIKR